MKPRFPHSHRAQVEVPVPWLESPHDGDRNRVMFDALRTVISQRNYALQWEDIAFRTETLRRSAPHNGFRLSYHSYGDVRHVWRIKETPIPYFYSFDRLGFSAWSEIGMFPERYLQRIEAVDISRANEFCTNLKKWLLTNNISKYKQSSEQVDLPARFVFFPLQLRNDIVARFCRIDPLRVLKAAAQKAKETKTHLVVKRHPFCKSRLTRAALGAICAGNPYVIESYASVQQLLLCCSSVIVANSGVGFEALIHGRPVYSFAASEYSLAVQPIRSLIDIKNAFSDINPASSNLSHKFAYFFLSELCFDTRVQSSIARMLDLAEASVDKEIWCEQDRHSILI